MSAVLQLTDLEKSYGDFTLDKVTFSVPKGAIVGLIGENGAGKTTTINLILRGAEKDGGQVFVFGKDHVTDEKAIKQRLGVITEDGNFPEGFTVSDIEKCVKHMFTSWRQDVFAGCISKFDLPSNKPIRAFSKGMNIMLNFAIALSHNAQLLILDEATSGLDPVMRDDILDILLDFVQDEENGILFSSHITSDLEKIADYIAFLHKGRLVFFKPKDELIYHYGIIRCGAAAFDALDKTDLIKCRRQDFEWQALVADRHAMEKKYPKCVIDNATIDDILLLYIRGE